jgi:1-acyl-sn-glycerol-3-phosphate acyltransferase
MVGNALVTFSWTGVMATYVVGYQMVHPDARALERHSQKWARGLARGWGVSIHAYGVDRIPSDSGCVLIANHQSYADIVALFLALPFPPVFLAKQELREVPVFGRAMEIGGHVFIDRAEHASAVETIEAAARKLRPGHPLLVFPEGTRGLREEVDHFKKGAFHLARHAGVPIVPIGLRGSRAVWPREARAAMPGEISVHVGEPISAAEVMSSDIEDLVARVRERVAELAAMPLASE